MCEVCLEENYKSKDSNWNIEKKLERTYLLASISSFLFKLLLEVACALSFRYYHG